MKLARTLFDFTNRHIGIKPINKEHILKYLGYDNMNNFIKDVNPNMIKYKLSQNKSINEQDSLVYLKNIMNQNKLAKNMIGLGYHDTILPNPIKKHILQNPKWYTAYTPYQAEISQGRLESQFNYQTMIEDLTKLDISNASLLDEASTISEVVNIFYNYNKKKKNTLICCEYLHPHIIHTLQTKCKIMDINLILTPIKQLDEDLANNKNTLINTDVMGIIFSYPDTYGDIYIPFNVIEHAKNNKILLCSNNDLLALTNIKPPGELDIDISFGTAQRFGIPLWFGGPHPSFLATNEKLLRYIPGRIIGKSIDSLNNPAFRLGLQTREQHIRRDKATSNICTTQSLLANVAAFYSIYHGPLGLNQIYYDINNKTLHLALELNDAGFNVINNLFFDTITIKFDKYINPHDLTYADNIYNLLTFKNILIRKEEQDNSSIKKLIISINEKTTYSDIHTIISIFNKFSNSICNHHIIDKKLPDVYKRNSKYLQQDVFNKFHTETELMRYIYKLASKDYTLCEGIIPLGSCTMKLNSATQLEPLIWNNITQIHPFAPKEYTKGYKTLIKNIGDKLKEITGFNNISFQSNSGSMGEYSGLLCIKEYHKNNYNDNNNIGRNICLIPNSAHGTNFASANLANMKIITFNDNLFENDFGSFVAEHKEQLACLMITYPNTNGTFQKNIKEICDIIHENGGLVYMDGANMNAQVGLTSPAICGADVCHLNIHKTFCIPHGGGGPGLGPILCNDKLAPYLPNNIIQDNIYPQKKDIKPFGSITSSNWSSASLLTIPYLYILNMGNDGLKEATEIAILNANYLKEKLKEYYTIIDVNENGMVGHEFIIDTSEFIKLGITEQDISKRLIDYKFHPPTMSWPRKNVLMFEPTESESKEELDRLVIAMISIRNEITEIENQIYPKNNNVLKNAPHPIHMINSWNFPYEPQKAFYPVDSLLQDKFWPACGRLDDIYGDKNILKK